MIIALRYNIPTVIYELYVRSRITTGLLYSIFGLRVPDDGTVTFYRKIKLKMGFGVVRCCYCDETYLQLKDMLTRDGTAEPVSRDQTGDVVEQFPVASWLHSRT